MTAKLGRLRPYLLLHGLLFLYSLTGVLSKFASKQEFLSLPFVLLYGGMLLILFIYAVFWQQILKMLPLTVAFANKAIVMAWGIIWGMLLFGEHLTWGMVAGVALVFAGILLVVGDNE